ncbi:MarR family transcriptional regulator [Streptomyces sp. NBC_01356]|uniref:MarR family winged helix-turn-helix transcriptional regulator n=1 Tax=Streptomyces sp. NBC_01356 TaxID=2903836 RepID=UPI002E2F6D03|nr:MarR family transcriptional regulator [Streptomyces sp. NBC_01356]
MDDFDREMARLLGVNETDLRCLELLMSGQPVAPGDLRDKLGLSSGSVTAMLDRLEKLEYLTRTPHPTDRRRSEVRITPQATTLAHRLMGPFLDDVFHQVNERYSGRELELVVDFLDFVSGIQDSHRERLREMPGPRAHGGAGQHAPGQRGEKGTRV